MPIPERVRSRKFYFTADELPADAKLMLGKMLTVQLQSEYGDAPDRSGAVCPTVEDKTWLDLQLSQEKEHGLGVAEMLTSIGIDGIFPHEAEIKRAFSGNRRGQGTCRGERIRASKRRICN